MLLIPLAAFTVALIYAATTDASSMRISNKTVMVVLAAFALATPLAWDGWVVFGEHMLVGLAFFVAGFTMFAVGGLGGGDAKLMAATGLWWTAGDAVPYIFWVTILGAALAIFLLLGRNFVPASVSTHPMVARMFSEQKKMPYGLALAGGALIVLPSSDIVQRALFL